MHQAKQKSSTHYHVLTDHYAKAFHQVIETEANAYVLKFDVERGFSTVRMKATGEVFYIAKYEDLLKDITEFFLDSDYMHVPAELLVEATDELYASANFIAEFLVSLDDNQYMPVNAVFAATAVAKDPSACFWTCLETIESGKLYSLAVAAAVKCSPEGKLLRQVADLYIKDGDKYLNMINDGVFELITLHDGTDSEGDFYVYSVDPALWHY